MNFQKPDVSLLKIIIEVSEGSIKIAFYFTRINNYEFCYIFQIKVMVIYLSYLYSCHVLKERTQEVSSFCSPDLDIPLQ